MQKLSIHLLIGTAIIFVLVGILYPFFELDLVPDHYDTVEHISAFFSLASVFLLFAALVFQNREYKLQVEELKKSADAQVKASAALEEQKQILLEQNNNSLILNMIQSFNDKKNSSEVNSAVDQTFLSYMEVFRKHYYEVDEGMDQKQASIAFARFVKNSFTKKIKEDANYYEVKQFVQFAYNIFYLIDQKKLPDKKDWFTAFVHNQLTGRETIVLYLSNLVDYDLGIYNGLSWNYYLVKDLIASIDPIGITSRGSHLDFITLTEEFNRIKQK